MALAVDDNAPDIEIENTEYGYHYAAKRTGPRTENSSKTHSVHVTAVILPTCRIIPLTLLPVFCFEVPQDDVRTGTYVVARVPQWFDRKKSAAYSGWTMSGCETRKSYECRAQRLLGEVRSKMDVAWSGPAERLVPEDASIGVSMGPIGGRTDKEMLVGADSTWCTCTMYAGFGSPCTKRKKTRSGSISKTIRRCGEPRQIQMWRSATTGGNLPAAQHVAGKEGARALPA